MLALAACAGPAPTTPASGQPVEEGGGEVAIASVCEGVTPMTNAPPELAAPEEPLRCSEFEAPPASRAPERARAARAETLHRQAQALRAAARYDEALPALRESLCLRDDAGVRHALAELLLTLGHAAGPSAPAEAIAYYRQSLLVEPNAETELFLRNVLNAMGETFELAAPPALALPGLYPSLDELCHALLMGELSEPVDASELPEDLCETSEWDDVGVAVGDDTDVFFQVALLTVHNPELYDGENSTLHLVARTPRGVNVLLDLGREHGSSRAHNAFVAAISTDYRFDSADAPLFVRWTKGEATASDCDWDASAHSQFAACGMVGDLPGCFAWASLGPAEYSSDTMLPTVQESLGNCDEDRPQSVVAPDPSRFGPAYDLSFSAAELAVTRSTDAAMTCLPLPESLTPLRQRAAGR